jgi:dTDP-glucose 4,6-dehydratase
VRDQDRQVLNIDLLSYASVPEALEPLKTSDGYRFLHADIRDRDAVAGALSEFQPDAVIHLAAETHVDRSIDGPRAFLEANVTGTFTLLEAVTAYWGKLNEPERQSFRLIHVSTDEVFGSLDRSSPPFHRWTPYAPRSPYSASKAAADHFVRAWHSTYRLPTIVTNCSNNFGPWQFPEKFIPVVILRSAAREPVPIYGSGSQIRDWLYVDDHAEGLVEVVSKGVPGSTYLFGARNEWPNGTLAHSVCDIVDELMGDGGPPRRELLQSVSDRPGHDVRYAIDPSAAERELGWKPQSSFVPALRSTVSWYLEHQAWVSERLRRTGGYRRLGLGAQA